MILADAYYAAGRREDALREYRTLARNDPADAALRKRIERLGGH
ncbi:MAG: hypothetical protein HC807_04925 [Gammaproteobacteria bacterium]|nr:hypothetical protein [Gammaproteobacteria bacterium]